MRSAVSLAWARLRYRPARWLLIVFGVTLAAALPVLAQGSSSVVAAQALGHGIEQLPVGERSLIVSYSGVQIPPTDLGQIDARAKSALRSLSAGSVTTQLLFRRISDFKGGTYFLGAADDLAQSVRITTGRLPVTCTPKRCEVVQLGVGQPTLDPTLGIVIVGHAERTNPLLLKGTFDPGNDAPLLLGDGVARTQLLASLELFQRSYGWVVPLDLHRVTTLGVEQYLAQSADVGDALGLAKSGTRLTAPDDVLRSEDERALRSSRRFVLLSGSATVLLLGFALIGALGLRRDHATWVALLNRRGAKRRSVRLLTGLVATVPVLLGTLLGIVVGAAGALVLASRAGLVGSKTTSSAVVRSAALGSLFPTLGTLLIAVTVIVLTLSWPEPEAGQGTNAWRVVDAAALACLGTAALALARGSIGTSSLDSGSDPLLLLLPILLVVSGALIAARLWPWATVGAARVVPSKWLAARLALLGALRRPLRPVATAGFLTGALGIVIFAGTYRATLAQGAEDQATFGVPLEARITPGTGLERPLDVADLSAFSSLAGATSVHPVVRSSAAIRVSAAEAVPVQILGVDPSALVGIHAWPNVVGSADAAEAARLIGRQSAAESVGFVVPQGTTRLVLPGAGTIEQLAVVAWIRASDGRDFGIELRQSGTDLVGTLPRAASAVTPGVTLRLTALTITESVDYATRHLHRIGEGTTSVSVLAGAIKLSVPQFESASGRSTTATNSWAGWGSSLAQVVGAQQLSVAYQLNGSRVVISAGYQASPAPLPALADPATAARASAGILSLADLDGVALPVRIVAVVPRFPTMGAHFVVVDASSLAERLDAGEPGTGATTELWLQTPPGQQAQLAAGLAAPPFDRLTIELRQTRVRALQSDPVARGASGLLAASAGLALLMAGLCLVLLVVVERRDEAAEFYAWESDGLAPRILRRVLFLRMVAVAAVAVPCGIVLGYFLSRITTALVTVTAVGATPSPPLALAFDAALLAEIVLLSLGFSMAAAAAVSFGAMRERLPTRPTGDAR